MWPVGILFAAYLFTLGALRYSTFHNQTFDLAFYSRMAWGLVHGNFWDPILNAHYAGLHISPVLVIGGGLGLLMPTALALYLIQSLSIGLAVVPLSKLVEGRAQWIVALLWCAHPNLTHVGSYEFHPGTVAVLPLTWAMVALKQKKWEMFAASVTGVLLCREDLAMVTMVLSAIAIPSMGRRARYGAAFSALYLLIFALWLHPRFAPVSRGSLNLHFGYLGGSIREVVHTLFLRPDIVWRHLSWRALGSALAPLCFLPLLKPVYLLATAPILGMNMLSAFPTTSQLDSHYLTPALPILFAAAIVGLTEVMKRFDGLMFIRNRIWTAWLIAAVPINLMFANVPWGKLFVKSDYLKDLDSIAGRRIVDRIPASVSVQAPDKLLAHLSERPLVKRGPLMDRPTDSLTQFVVIDTGYRQHYIGQEALLRTTEEPQVRAWLARKDYEIIAYEKPFLLLQHNVRFPTSYQATWLHAAPQHPMKRKVTQCLRLDGYELKAQALELTFHVSAQCRDDIAIRFEYPLRKWRTDLLCEGSFAPSKFPVGHWIRSVHTINSEENEMLTSNPSFSIGMVRSDGKTVEPSDPFWVHVNRKPTSALFDQ